MNQIKKIYAAAIATIAIAGSINAQTICGGDTVCFTTSARGTIQWQHSTNQTTWTNLAGVTGDTACFAPTATGWYRAEITDGTCDPIYSDTNYLTVVGATGVDTFYYTGAVQMFVVPCSKTFNLNVWGAQGGDDTPTAGGMGGYSTGQYTANAGDTLWIYVGGKGTDGPGGLNCNSPGGWNGGGPTGSICCSNAGGGAGAGGGGTDIRVNGQALTNRVIITGGGGGAGSNNVGAAGGGTTGGNGNPYNGVSAIGGSQTAGGTPGGHFTSHTCIAGTSGALGQGGMGDGNDGGGGGGGYYGGGGGANNGGGAGGSGYIGGVTGGTMTSGVRSGHGLVIITW